MAKLVCALTGGIATGKTTVSELFAQQGIPTIDTDQVARKLVKPRTPLLACLTKHFGKEILLADGTLNRQKLRELIFTHPTEKAWLEQQMHPLIREEATSQAQALSTKVALIAIPLLKSRMDYPICQKIIAIETPLELQIQRVMNRDKLTFEQAQAIINAQPSPQHYRNLADFVIHNDGNFTRLKAQVHKLSTELLYCHRLM